MFHNLGVQWATTLLALLATLLVPVPILFYYYGERIRAKSSFAVDDPSAPPAPKNKKQDIDQESSSDETACEDSSVAGEV